MDPVPPDRQGLEQTGAGWLTDGPWTPACMQPNPYAMFLINNDEVTDPVINLALEEHCFRNLDPAYAYVLFYINQPSIIIGRHQNPFQEFNQDLARRRKIHLVRRISGGGAVYHDPGNLNFSFITDFNEDKLDYFKVLLKPILSTLQQLGIPAQLTERNNIVVDGKKVSGTSQHTNMRRMLSHGTLLFDSDLEMLERVLASELRITHSRAVKSIPSQVTNIGEHLRRPMDLDVFRTALVDGISEVLGETIEYRLTAEDWETVDLLAKIKYKSWDWTFGRSPKFSVQHQIRTESGDVSAHFVVINGIIRDIVFADQSANFSWVHKIRDELISARYNAKFSADMTPQQ
jgi:lipoate-protein ligase A